MHTSPDRSTLLLVLLSLMLLAACASGQPGPANIAVEVSPDPIVGEVVTMYTTASRPEGKPDYWHERVEYYELRITTNPAVEVIAARMPPPSDELTVSDFETEPVLADSQAVAYNTFWLGQLPADTTIEAEVDFRIPEPGENFIEIWLSPHWDGGPRDYAGAYYPLWLSSTDTNGEAMLWYLVPTEPFDNVILATEYINIPGALIAAPTRTASPTPIITMTPTVEPTRSIVGTP